MSDPKQYYVLSEDGWAYVAPTVSGETTSREWQRRYPSLWHALLAASQDLLVAADLVKNQRVRARLMLHWDTVNGIAHALDKHSPQPHVVDATPASAAPIRPAAERPPAPHQPEVDTTSTSVDFRTGYPRDAHPGGTAPLPQVRAVPFSSSPSSSVYEGDNSTSSPSSHLGWIVPAHCSGYSFVFDPGVLHVKKDGSGYIAIDEDDLILEDDLDGEGGSVHWIARFGASEMIALRDFINGAPLPQPNVACPCTLVEQDEDCPVGYPSMICGICKGTGNTTQEQVTVLACEMIKIANDMGEPEDPFAAWESIELLKSKAPSPSPTVNLLQWIVRGKSSDGPVVYAGAFGISRFYSISGTDGDWTLSYPGADCMTHIDGIKTQHAARAAAQDDYGNRALATLAAEGKA